MIRIEHPMIITTLNTIARLNNTKQKILFVEFGKKILFGLKEPIPCCFGCKYFYEMSYLEYAKKTFKIWVFPEKINKDNQ